MITKEDILKNYYSHSTDGLAEISGEDLLKAMEEYRQQAEKNAFNAARRLTDGKYKFSDFAAYAAHININKITDDMSESIKTMADSILPQFIPNDHSTKNLSFKFKTRGVHYNVLYTKNQQGYWEFNSFNTVENI